MASSSGQHSGWSYWRWFVCSTTIAFLIGIPLLVSFAILLSPIVVFLWNTLMPSLFGLKQISWLQAVGLYLLARLLFSSK